MLQHHQQHHQQLRLRRPNKLLNGEELIYPSTPANFLSDLRHDNSQPQPNNHCEPNHGYQYQYTSTLQKHGQTEEKRTHQSLTIEETRQERAGWVEESERNEAVMEVLVSEDLSSIENSEAAIEPTLNNGSEDELEEEDDLLAEEILAESKEIQVNKSK